MAHRPDSAVAKASEFTIHPAGQFAARCVDVINLGLTVIKAFTPKDKDYLAEKIALVFWTGETDEAGKPLTVKNEFTLTMGEKGRLRPFLESWRNKKYTPDEAKKGIDVSKLYGYPALIGVGHEESNGKTYANIVSIAQLPKQMLNAVPDVDQIPYTRDEWWTKKKQDTQANTQAWLEAQENAKGNVTRSINGKKADPNFSDFPEAADGDDDLPF